MHYGAVFLVFLISFLVKCEASSNGNLSAGINLTPRITTTTVAPGLGRYILAALGQTLASQPNTTATVTLNSTSSTSNTSSRVSSPHTVCYSGADGRCFTDVFYTTPNIASTGTGSAYATSCSNVLSSYSSASSSWGVRHSSVTNQTNYIGGTTWIPVTYYANATTLCDGHARVNYSPAIATSSTTITTVKSPASESIVPASVGWMFPLETPTCSINPSDCDGLWQAYSTSSSKWAAAANATYSADAVFPTITASPSVPPCINSSQSSSDEAFSKSFYGCGLCTIFGNEVQLVYFPEPTTVSRDMCAKTPSAKLTHYGKDDGVPYTGADPSATWTGSGTPVTAVAGDHTFTSGTAYISIKQVWAVDRCSSQIGTTVSDAVLALPSERLLSLRYSQDHFQYFATTDKVTGYPFNYADLNTPVPYSAWNGQARCDFPGAADYKCNVIYEHDYNPQLAMPPGIRKLNPEWEHCQMWYGGLYDPPYALKPGTAVAVPTVAFSKPPVTSAAPSSSAAATTPTHTALADHTTDRSSQDTQAGNEPQATQSVNPQAKNQNTDGVQTQGGAQNSQGSQNSQDGTGNNQGINTQNGAQTTQEAQNNQGGNQNSQGAETQKVAQSTHGTQNQGGAQSNQGVHTQNGGQNTRSGGQAQNNAQNTQGSQTGHSQNGAQNNQGPHTQGGSTGGASPVKPNVYVFTAGTSTYTATSTNSVYVCGTNTLSVGGPAATLSGGCVISAGAGGLVVNNSPSTVINSASAITALPAITKGVVITVGTKIQTVSCDTAGEVQIGSARLSPGGPAITLDDGSVVSAASNGVVIGSSTAKYSAVNAASPDVVVFVVGTKTVTASCPPGATNQAVIGTVTLTAGGSVQTLDDGSRVSLASGGAILVDGTSAATLSRAVSAVVFTVNGTPVTAYQAAGATGVATIDGTIISQGGPAATFSNGEVISMGSGGLVVQRGSSTVPATAFTTMSETSDTPSTSSGASPSQSDAQGNTAVRGSRTAQVAQGTQSSATASRSSSNAGSGIHISLTTSLLTIALLISPLIFAVYL